MTDTGTPPVPPPPPTSEPPPPTGGGSPPPSRPPLPWEDRDRLGFFEALLETVKILVPRPQEAFERMREKGDYLSPLLFHLILGAFGVVLQGVWGSVWKGITGPPDLSQVPEEMRRYVEMFSSSTGGTMLLSLFMVPVLLFAISGLVHLALMAFGGLKQSPTDFEGTFRSVAYANVAQLAVVLPMMGGMVAAVWSMVVTAIGLTKLHRCSTGTAVMAVLAPLILCCLCCGVAVFAAFSMGMMAGLAGS
jgi:hypothetical protein